MRNKLHLSKKRILYTICFFFFCLIDQRIKTGSGLDGWIETFRSLTGVIVAILILSHFSLDDIKKCRIPYLVWSLICAIGGALFIAGGQSLHYFWNDRIAMTANVFLYGLILIRFFYQIVPEKRKLHFDRRFALVWLLMMGLMCVSRNGSHWPAGYLIMFGCFYLTDYSAEEQEDLFQGMLDGIILGFFLQQGWCFVFRPYDQVRYVGAYNNSNLNALFYLVVLAAVLSKLVYVYATNRPLWAKIYYWLGTGTVLGFLFMTIGRTGWMTAVILVLVALLFLWRAVPGKKLLSCVVKNGLTAVLCFLLLFPAVFSAVRYFPPLFHHPVWFFGEWSEDKVHSWDPWDSDKFVDLDKLMRTANKRVADVLESVMGKTQEEQPAEDTIRLEAEGTDLAKQEVTVSPLQQQLYEEALAAGFAIDPADRKNAVLVRKAIYRYYFHLLNLSGHSESEQGFQIVPDHRIGHAHNIYLQWGVDFGIPAMILFLILVIGSGIRFVKEFLAEKSVSGAGCFLIMLVPCIFGMLEYAWGAGSLTITLLFVIWRRMICNEVKEGR